MNILFIGDLVGPAAVHYLTGRLPELRRTHAIDLVIANAENSAPGGAGMTVSLNTALFAYGVDVITSGNHSWDGGEAEQALAQDRVLRPYNLPSGVSGSGVISVQVGDEVVTVINLADSAAMNRLYTPTIPADLISAFTCWEGIPRQGTVIVDYHGESMNGKQAFAHFVDGQAAAVLGTHTHEPTLLLHLLANGTAFVGDVGMTGSYGGVQGFDPPLFIRRYLGHPEAEEYAKVVEAPISLAAVLLHTIAGRTTAIRRLT